MTPTLAALLSAPGLGLRVLAGVGSDPADRAAALRRPITWVAVSELADPRPYLEGGELVLLTGLVTDLHTDARPYVERLVEAGVAAVGLGIGVLHPEVPATLVAAADAAGLPLLEVDPPTPFIAVGKALADLLALEQGERTRRRLDGMRALTARLAGNGDLPPDPQPALRQLADLVDGWAALLDARGRLRVVTGRHPRPEVARHLTEQLRGRVGHTSAAEPTRTAGSPCCRSACATARTGTSRSGWARGPSSITTSSPSRRRCSPSTPSTRAGPGRCAGGLGPRHSRASSTLPG